MKALYFDCFSGISGDMTLGALIDLGIDKRKFISELGKLNLSGYDTLIEKKEKNGIIGTDVQVLLNEEKFNGETKEHEHNGPHECHAHNHHQHGHDGHGHTARNLKDIELIIDSSDLSQRVKDLSKKVFREIARAEAKVHNKDISKIHFHEVGAVDSIVDIVGAAICLDLLGVDKVFSSPLHDGHGFIECQHGTIPVPVPAVMEMLKGTKIPVITEEVCTELVTPTGMGLIKCIASSYGSMPPMAVEQVGYGMGKRDTGKFNALRVVMGTLLDKNKVVEEIAVLETNIDDMNPEILAYVSERLMESGALDVFYTPVYMKKSRPAVMLTVLSPKEIEQRLVDLILKETSTLGVRRTNSVRYCMDREVVKIPTKYGKVRVKVASMENGTKKFAPEFEDCKKIAQETGMPLQQVYDLVKKECERAGL